MKSKNVLIFILVLAVLLMGGSYAFIAEDISNVAKEKLKGTSWKASISEVQVVSQSGKGTSLIAQTSGMNIKVKADLVDSYDEVIYRFVVKNEGNIDILVNSLTGIKELNDKRADVFLHLEGLNAGDILSPGEEVIVSLHLGLNEGSSPFNELVTIGINLSQA